MVDSSSSRLDIGDSECERDVRGEAEGELLFEWFVGVGFVITQVVPRLLIGIRPK